MTPREAQDWLWCFARQLWLSLGRRGCKWPTGSMSELNGYMQGLRNRRLDICRHLARTANGRGGERGRASYVRGLACFVLRLLPLIEAPEPKVCATCRHWMPQRSCPTCMSGKSRPRDCRLCKGTWRVSERRRAARLGLCTVAALQGLEGEWYHLSTCDSPPYVAEIGESHWEPCHD